MFTLLPHTVKNVLKELRVWLEHLPDVHKSLGSSLGIPGNFGNLQL